jgi:hypothetical protein
LGLGDADGFGLGDADGFGWAFFGAGFAGALCFATGFASGFSLLSDC